MSEAQAASCRSCGIELPAEARFCVNCGVADPVESLAEDALTVPRARVQGSQGAASSPRQPVAGPPPVRLEKRAAGLRVPTPAPVRSATPRPGTPRPVTPATPRPATPPPASVVSELEDDLEEIRYLLEQGLEEDAREAFERLRARVPNHPELDRVEQTPEGGLVVRPPRTAADRAAQPSERVASPAEREPQEPATAAALPSDDADAVSGPSVETPAPMSGSDGVETRDETPEAGDAPPASETSDPTQAAAHAQREDDDDGGSGAPDVVVPEADAGDIEAAVDAIMTDDSPLASTPDGTVIAPHPSPPAPFQGEAPPDMDEPAAQVAAPAPADEASEAPAPGSASPGRTTLVPADTSRPSPPAPFQAGGHASPVGALVAGAALEGSRPAGRTTVVPDDPTRPAPAAPFAGDAPEPASPSPVPTEQAVVPEAAPAETPEAPADPVQARTPSPSPVPIEQAVVSEAAPAETPEAAVDPSLARTPSPSPVPIEQTVVPEAAPAETPEAAVDPSPARTPSPSPVPIEQTVVPEAAPAETPEVPADPVPQDADATSDAPGVSGAPAVTEAGTVIAANPLPPAPYQGADAPASVGVVMVGSTGKPVHERVLAPGEALEIGRGDDAPWADDSKLEPRHARLVAAPEGLAVEAFDPVNGVFREIETRIEVRDGDAFRVGESLVTYERDGGPAGSHGRIVVTFPDGDTRVHPLDAAGLLLGRDEVDVSFDEDTYVSAEHCRITCEGAKVFLEDLGSSNGTHVRLRRGEHAAFGARILMGHSQFVVARRTT